ncbi:MAG: hypothetical protein IJ439_03575 [Tyzzerella sp.]|nr:hypothetical protein [Tyzzerella sp.]
MIATDEEALICDLMETYHIYDYRSLPLTKVATFSVGLRGNSRIKMKMNNMKYSLETILLASAIDRLSFLVWSKTEDGAKGINKPQSIVETMLGENKEKDIVAFDTPDAFETEWKRIVEREVRDE